MPREEVEQRIDDVARSECRASIAALLQDMVASQMASTRASCRQRGAEEGRGLQFKREKDAVYTQLAAWDPAFYGVCKLEQTRVPISG